MSEAQLHDELYDDAFVASLSLEEELLGKGYGMTATLGSSLAAELESATNPSLEPLSPSPSSKLASLAMDRSLSSPLRRQDGSPQIEFNKYLGSSTSTSLNSIDNNHISTSTSTSFNNNNNINNNNNTNNNNNNNNINHINTNINTTTTASNNNINSLDSNTLSNEELSSVSGLVNFYSTGHNNNNSGILDTNGYIQDNFSDQTSPIMSPLQWSSFGRSRRSSFSSTWSSLEPEVDDDPFEVLKRQLEELNSVVWETKTLHKRLSHTLSSTDDRSPFSSSRSMSSLLQQQQLNGRKVTTTMMDGGKPLELIMTSVASLVENKSRDRERQTNSLRNLESVLRKEAHFMPLDALRELEHLVGQMKVTLYDKAYSYENPLPLLRHLTMETTGMTDTLEELKEIMYVNKRQVTELNQRLRSIAKTVHEVRKDIRRINKFLEEKDDDDALILEKGEVQERVKEILWGLDDLDSSSSKKIKQMQLYWEEQFLASAAAS